MKEYLKQRLEELNKRWESTQKKYLNPANDLMATYYWAELKHIEGGIKEVKIMLFYLESKEKQQDDEEIKK